MSAPAAETLNTGVHNFAPTVFHYFKNEAITRGLVLGTKERALCGVRQLVGVATTDTLGGDSGAVICPLCHILMDAMKAGKR